MKRPKHKTRKLIRPPTTRRFCMRCKMVTEFEFNHRRGHSDCIECGFFYIR